MEEVLDYVDTEDFWYLCDYDMFYSDEEYIEALLRDMYSD